MRHSFLILLATASVIPVSAQQAELRPVERLSMPAAVDSNSPVVRIGRQLRIFTSLGEPMVSVGRSQTLFRATRPVLVNGSTHFPMWIESVWLDRDDKLYAWYHHERRPYCGDVNLRVPEIGALVSTDGGLSFTDLGIVLASSDPDTCDSQNGYFAGGHGDFSVIPDKDLQYFYFFYGNYGGDPANQGVSVARMAAADRDQPIGKVWKYYEGLWNEPGIGGRQTPIFPTAVDWQRPDTDSFWGPSVHWNTHLEAFVMLLNRSCCEPGWPQEGIYIAYSSDLSNPMAWTQPAKLLGGGDWYPQVIGNRPGEGDTLAGEAARLYMRGESEWEIVFQR